MSRPGPRYWFEWMALVLMGLALLLVFEGWLFPDTAPSPGEPPQGDVLWTYFSKGIGLVVGGLSVLLLLVRPLLSLRLWYSWVGLLAGGVILYAARDLVCEGCCHLNFEVCALFSMGGATDLALLSFVFFVAQWQARRLLRPAQSSDTTSPDSDTRGY
jgi:hypothetical protein